MEQETQRLGHGWIFAPSAQQADGGVGEGVSGALPLSHEGTRNTG